MSETMGRCRSEVDDCYGGLPLVAIADAIDRLAADVAAVKAKVDAVSPQPEARPAGWLTERERHILSSMLSERPDWSLHWVDDIQPVFRSILARAGSPPVVEVPAMESLGDTACHLARAYRAAMDKARVPWKEVGRE